MVQITNVHFTLLPATWWALLPTDPITVTERTKVCAQKWQHIVWRKREKENRAIFTWRNLGWKRSLVTLKDNVRLQMVQFVCPEQASWRTQYVHCQNAFKSIYHLCPIKHVLWKLVASDNVLQIADYSCTVMHGYRTPTLELNFLYWYGWLVGHQPLVV